MYEIIIHKVDCIVAVKKEFRRARIVIEGDSLRIRVSRRVRYSRAIDDLVKLERMGIVGDIRCMN